MISIAFKTFSINFKEVLEILQKILMFLTKVLKL